MPVAANRTGSSEARRFSVSVVRHTWAAVRVAANWPAAVSCRTPSLRCGAPAAIGPPLRRLLDYWTASVADMPRASFRGKREPGRGGARVDRRLCSPRLGLRVSGSERKPACRGLSSDWAHCIGLVPRSVDWVEAVCDVVGRRPLDGMRSWNRSGFKSGTRKHRSLHSTISI